MEQNTVLLKDNMANPAPLGLFGFGLTTVLLNLQNAGLFDLDSMILAMGLFYGGIAQVIAGIIEGKKNNTFGLTAFISYGFFWISLVALIVMPKLGWIAPVSAGSMIAYLILWGIFTAFLLVGTFKISRALQFVFFTLTVLYILLAIGEASGDAAIKHIAGYEGILCGALAIYAGAATLLNEIYGSTILPVGLVTAKSKANFSAKPVAA